MHPWNIFIPFPAGNGDLSGMFPPAVFIFSPLIDGVTFRGEDCTSLARESGGVLDVLAGKRAEGG